MDIVIESIDIARVPADLVVLKHADGFYGADRAIAKAIGFDGSIGPGQSRVLPGKGIAAREVLFIGVGRLHEFRYEKIQEFGSAAMKAARQHQPPVQHLGLTIHGPGYGLDVEQSFLSMVAGMVGEYKNHDAGVQKVTIADRSEKRCELLARLLAETRGSLGLEKGSRQEIVTVSEGKRAPLGPETTTNVVQFGSRAENKARLFVAMPFAEKYVDEFEIGFREAAKVSDFICERLDVEAFVGDIAAEIKRRIVDSHGVIALLNDHNPNVFLEIGFAFAHNRPTILVAKDDVTLPFDVSGQRCIRYRSITQLRDLLQREIATLKAQGVLGKRA